MGKVLVNDLMSMPIESCTTDFIRENFKKTKFEAGDYQVGIVNLDTGEINKREVVLNNSELEVLLLSANSLVNSRNGDASHINKRIYISIYKVENGEEQHTADYIPSTVIFKFWIRQRKQQQERKIDADKVIDILSLINENPSDVMKRVSDKLDTYTGVKLNRKTKTDLFQV